MARLQKGLYDLETWCRQNNKEILLDEWDYEKNGCAPNELTPASGKKMYWICKKCKHNYVAAIYSRTSGHGCPVCANRVIVTGQNDFQTYCYKNNKTELLSEYCTDLNEKKANEIGVGIAKKIYWKCKKCNQAFEATINDRLHDRGCPYCSNRKIKAGVNDFGTQCIKNDKKYLLDEWDYEKNIFLPQDITYGKRYEAWWICYECGESYKQYVHSRWRGQGCPKCNNFHSTSFGEQVVYYYVKKSFPLCVNRDKQFGVELDIYIPEIRSGVEYDGCYWHQDLVKDNIKDMQCIEKGVTLYRVRESVNPQVEIVSDNTIVAKYNNLDSLEKAVKELLLLLGSSDSDIDIKRDRIAIYENYISGKRENSLAAKYPMLAKEWHPIRNGKLSPLSFTVKSNKLVWWLAECGHEWQARINTRVEGESCPYCANKTILQGFNDMATKRPELLIDWDYKKNKILPTEIFPNTRIKLFWICHKCGKEYTTMGARQKRPGCVKCGFRKRRVRNMDTYETFDSVKSAADSVNGSDSVIYRCCNEKIKTAYGYHWSYIDEQ